MAHTASVLNSKSEFDKFLFAPVGEDKRGTVVSVLTAFARLDFDPWQQAADFARLPREKAKAKLAAMITTLPGMSPSHAEPAAVAAGLIALLPAPPLGAAVSRANWLGPSQPANFRSPRYIISIAIFMALGTGSQFLLASLQPPVNGPQAQASDTTHQQAPTPSQGAAVTTTVSAIGDIMSNGNKPRDLINLRAKDGKAALVQPAQQSQASAASKPAQTTSPVRRPLFGR